MPSRLQCNALMAALLLLSSGCQSVPPREIPVSPDSSVLAVDVTFPHASNRSGYLVGVVFLKEPLHGRLDETAEMVPASWIKGSRAYLLNPEPGTYFVAAVSSAVRLPTVGASVSLGAGVTGFVSTPGAVGHTVILPEEMILRTRTMIGPHRVEFAGALQIGYFSSDRINASTEFDDELQRRIAELLNPGVTSKWGLAGQFTRTWKPNQTLSSIKNEASDRESFLGDVREDFGDSPWAEVLRSARSTNEPAKFR